MILRVDYANHLKKNGLTFFRSEAEFLGFPPALTEVAGIEQQLLLRRIRQVEPPATVKEALSTPDLRTLRLVDSHSPCSWR